MAQSSIPYLSLVLALLSLPVEPLGTHSPPQTFLGFDANSYPGDALLPALRRTFAFTGFWLNVPPGAAENAWREKRSVVREAGFGFLVLFNGRLAQELHSAEDAAALGASDGRAATAAAQREGFPTGTAIFLDQEEGGRMTDAQLAYILGWVDVVRASEFRAGVYCSGMPAQEGKNETIITANDIRDRAGGREIRYFVYNDACPPAPGCVYLKNPPRPSASGVAFAAIWQFAQSPRRRQFTRSCAATYNRNGNCYPPLALPASVMLDLDSATSPDPSAGR
jgi:hypothetical protein